MMSMLHLYMVLVKDQKLLTNPIDLGSICAEAVPGDFDNELAFYQTIHGFNTPVKKSFWKQCWKRRKCR